MADQRTNEQKIDCVIATLTIMRPRLTAPFQSDAAACVQLLKDVKADIPGHILRNIASKPVVEERQNATE